MVKRRDPKKRKILIYILTVVFSVAFILVGRGIAMQGYPEWEAAADAAQKAVVTEILSVTDTETGQQVTFLAEMKQGAEKGETVQAAQSINTSYYPVQESVQPGDKVLLYRDVYGINTPWTMLEYVRSDAIIILAVLFVAAVILFGRMKGVNTIVSLGFTCLAVFMVMIPSILSGQNIYVWSVVVCLYIIIMTMLFINGADKKSFAAGMGCFSGVAVAGILTLIMDRVLKLTGMVNEDTLYLQMLDIASPIDLRAIIFAAITIGALGAIMDVAMDIASSLREIRHHSPDVTARQLMHSGLNIGRDVMGTMANTLVLAYIGSSLSTTLLLVAYNVAPIELFNMELIIVELLQALVGSIGILLSIPLTALICAAIYPGKKAGKSAAGQV